MNKDEIKGKVNDVKGRVERQAGEWTGDTDAQVKGAGDQLKGKVQQGVGKMKDAGNKAMRDLQHGDHRDERDMEREREDKAA